MLYYIHNNSFSMNPQVDFCIFLKISDLNFIFCFFNDSEHDVYRIVQKTIVFLVLLVANLQQHTTNNVCFWFYQLLRNCCPSHLFPNRFPEPEQQLFFLYFSENQRPENHCFLYASQHELFRIIQKQWFPTYATRWPSHWGSSTVFYACDPLTLSLRKLELRVRLRHQYNNTDTNSDTNTNTDTSYNTHTNTYINNDNGFNTLNIYIDTTYSFQYQYEYQYIPILIPVPILIPTLILVPLLNPILLHQLVPIYTNIGIHSNTSTDTNLPCNTYTKTKTLVLIHILNQYKYQY